MHAFVGQTDGQTDRILIAKPRLHSAARYKRIRQRDVALAVQAEGENLINTVRYLANGAI